MATEAGMMRCPNCGGDVAESARTCGYCRVELATVRCHHCYAMNAARSAHCSGCGRELGLSPVGSDDERTCPTCETSLLAFSGTGGILLDCASCGGQFVEHELLASLLESREVTGLAVPRRVRRAALGLGAVRYVPCPLCRELMNRKNFGGASGVVVDVCRTHGTWFDAGELPAALAFVETGGLVVAHARERQRERERESELERARATRTFSAGSSADPVGSTGDLESIADATMELFDWLASRWKIR
jgi:Zn-finger nucleic acid-binding protein